jgi:GNAT superfamily N-acetyltransferase
MGKQNEKVNPERKRRTRQHAALEPGFEAERLVFHEVDRSRWDDLKRLFESRGGPKSCWCMVWRATPQESRKTDGKSRKIALQRRIQEGVAVGILGYLDGEPVTWCSIAPRPTYRDLGGEIDSAEKPENIWSLVCFFITRRLRGQGMMERLIQAAIEHARKHGATVVEAYPVEQDSPSYRFMGFVPSFEAAGFREIGRAGIRRHVMRLRVS